MIDPKGTPDPVDALGQLYTWLTAGGPHFTGRWECTQQRTGDGGMEHAFLLHYQEPLPDAAKKCLPKFARLFMRECGWKAKGICFNKGKMELHLTPWPIEKQVADRRLREEFRQAALRNRERRLVGQSDPHTPALSRTMTPLPVCTELEDGVQSHQSRLELLYPGVARNR